MGKLIGGIAGAVIGSTVGMPQLGFMVGSMVGGALFPNEAKVEGPRMGDLSVSSSSYGVPIPNLYGTARLPGNLIWATGIREDKTKKRKTDKLAGVATTSLTYIYMSDFAMAFTAGPVGELTRVWADSKLIYDRTGMGLVTNTKFRVRWYSGDETQLPDALIESNVGAGLAPAYRGLSYAVFEDFELTNFGNRIPTIMAEITAVPNNAHPYTTLTEQTSPALARPTNGSLAVDWVRGRAYSFGYVDSSTYPEGGITVFDLDSMAVIRQVPLSDIFPDGFTGYIPNAFNGGTPANFVNLATIGVEPGGSIFIQIGGGNSEPLYELDPDSMTVVHWFGEENAEISNTATSIVRNTEIYTAMTTQHVYGATDVKNFVATTNFGGAYMALNADPAAGDQMLPALGVPTWANYTTMAYTGIWGHSRFVPGARNISPMGGDSDLYLFNYMADAPGAGTTVDLYRFTLLPNSGSTLTTGANEPGTLLKSFAAADYGGTGIWLRSAVYDKVDDTLIIWLGTSAGVTTIKFDPATLSIVWTQVYGATIQSPDVSAGATSTVTGSKFGWGGNYPTIIDTATGALVYSGNITGTVPGYPGAYATAWDSGTESLIYFNTSNTFTRVYYDRSAAADVAVSEIITDLCERAKLALADIDTAGIDQTTKGYVLSRPTSARAALEQICGAYFIEVVESDYKLKFRKRGGTPSETITQKWLTSASDSGTNGEYWKTTMRQEIEVARRVTVNYMDPTRDYQPGTQSDQRVSLPYPTMWSDTEMNMEIPIVMSADEARQIAQKTLWTQWTERNTYASRLPWRFLHLDPTDTVEVTLDDGTTYVVRMSKVEVGADYSVGADFVAEDEAMFSSNILGGTSDGFPTQSLPNPRPARLFMLNLPLLSDAEVTAGAVSRFYYAAAPFGADWRGANLDSSTDGVDYSTISTIVDGSNWGVALSILPVPEGGAFATDTTSSLRVYLSDGSTPPASCTRAALLDGANVAIVGEELIQFQTVVDNGDGTYTLTNLLRGRRGTDWACGTHVSGETFLVLDSASLTSQIIDLSEINVSRYWKLVTFGLLGEDIPPTTFTPGGYDLKPYAPVGHTRAPSGSDLTVSWIRRTRYGGELMDGTGTVPLGEVSEGYEVYILSAPYNASTFDATNATTYVRKVSGLISSTFTYTAAQMTADGFTPSTGTLHLVVFQLSDSIGRGFPGPADLEP